MPHGSPAVLLVALGTTRDAETEPWTDSAPAVVPAAPTAEAVAASAAALHSADHSSEPRKRPGSSVNSPATMQPPI